MAEQLVAVPVIEHVRVAPGSEAWGLGFMRISVRAPRGRVRHWLERHHQARVVYKYWP